jgi:ankyrin repeat protein
MKVSFSSSLRQRCSKFSTRACRSPPLFLFWLYVSCIVALITAGGTLAYDAKREVSFNNPLVDAADRGDIPSVMKWLRARTHVDVRGDFGITPLMRASFRGHKEIVRLLLGAGADPDAVDLAGTTALHIAARQGQKEILALLVKADATVDARDDNGWTPLMRSVGTKSSAIIRYLLAHGADPFQMNDWQQNAFELAIRSHNSSVVEAFHHIEVPENAKLSPEATKKLLHLAKQKRDPRFQAAVQTLLDRISLVKASVAAPQTHNIIPQIPSAAPMPQKQYAPSPQATAPKNNWQPSSATHAPERQAKPTYTAPAASSTETSAQASPSIPPAAPNPIPSFLQQEVKQYERAAVIPIPQLRPTRAVGKTAPDKAAELALPTQEPVEKIKEPLPLLPKPSLPKIDEAGKNIAVSEIAPRRQPEEVEAVTAIVPAEIELPLPTLRPQDLIPEIVIPTPELRPQPAGPALPMMTAISSENNSTASAAETKSENAPAPAIEHEATAPALNEQSPFVEPLAEWQPAPPATQAPFVGPPLPITTPPEPLALGGVPFGPEMPSTISAAEAESTTVVADALPVPTRNPARIPTDELLAVLPINEPEVAPKMTALTEIKNPMKVAKAIRIPIDERTRAHHEMSTHEEGKGTSDPSAFASSNAAWQPPSDVFDAHDFFPQPVVLQAYIWVKSADDRERLLAQLQQYHIISGLEVTAGPSSATMPSLLRVGPITTKTHAKALCVLVKHLRQLPADAKNICTFEKVAKPTRHEKNKAKKGKGK